MSKWVDKAGCAIMLSMSPQWEQGANLTRVVLLY